MAERQNVLAWLRRYLPTILAGATIATLTVTTLTVTTITGTTATFDDLTVTDDLTVGDDATFTAGDILGTAISIAGSTSVTASTASGGSVQTSAGGVTIAASSSGDDLSLSCQDDLSIATSDGTISLNANGANNPVTIASASYQVAILANTQAALDCNGASCVTNVRALGTTSSVWIEAVGEDITLDTTSGGGGAVGDDIVIAAGDDLVATITDDISITADQWSMTNASTTITTFNANGVTLNASGANDDVQIDAADDFVWTAGDDITITANGGTLYLDAASGVGPTMPLVGGGTGYRLAPSLEFDFVNAAPGSTAQTIMAALDLPALALSATGRGVRFEFHGLAAANANDKTIRILFGADGSGTGGGTETATVNVGGAAAAAGGHVFCHGYLYRSASDAQRAALVCVVGLITRTHSSTAAIDDGAATEVNLTVENPTSASDLTIYGVEWTWL